MAQQITRVMPGDLIKAELMNHVLTEIADLQQRVLDLEHPGQTLRVFRIEGPSPIRVFSRVTVVGQNFSKPAERNGVTVDGTAVRTLVSSASDDKNLVFDMPDPGLAGIGRTVTLRVTNADGQSDQLSFRVEPPVVVPFGTLAVIYENPPVGVKLDPGYYEFGFRLEATVDMDITVQLGADLGGATGWVARILRADGSGIASPISVSRSPGSLPFLLGITVPATGGGSATVATLEVSAKETTPGSRVTPAPLPRYTLTRGLAPPVPEKRVTVEFQNSSGVTVDGSTVRFTRGTRGRLDFGFKFDLGAGFSGSTQFNWSFTLDAATNTGWTSESPSTTGTTVNGATGAGGTSIGFTPGAGAGNTHLSLRITASPTGQRPIDVSYVIPMSVG